MAQVCKISSRTQMWFIVWVFDRIGLRACIGVCCRTLPRKDRLTGNRLTSHLCLWRMDEVLLCVFDGVGSRACIGVCCRTSPRKNRLTENRQTSLFVYCVRRYILHGIRRYALHHMRHNALLGIRRDVFAWCVAAYVLCCAQAKSCGEWIVN